MRAAISSACLVVSVTLVGACFDPTRTCSTNADCVNGGTCDPGTKTCVSGSNPNDKTPPVFRIAVVPPPARQNTGKLTELDPGSPDGGVDAFRRDESATVIVTSQDQDVDAGSVKLQVHGLSSSAAGTVLQAQLEPCAPGSLGAASPFCRQATVALGSLPFDAFRGVLVLEASGSDLSTNVGQADGGINVTRWKWRYSAGAPIYTTPAIADDGTIVFGTSDGGSGSLYALTPAGEERWTPLVVGSIEASTTIGPGTNASALIYVAPSLPAGSRINAVRLSDGSDAGVCLGSSGFGFSKPILGGLALVSTPGDTGSFESVVGLAGGTRLVTFRPTAQGTIEPSCLEAAAPFQQSRFETIVSDGAALYLGAEDSSLRSFVFETTSINWAKNMAWGVSGAVLVGDSELSPLAIDGPDLYFGVHPFGLVRVLLADGSATSLGPDGGVQGDPSGPAIGRDSLILGAGTESLPYVLTLDRQTTILNSALSSGLVRAVPTLGADRFSYALTAAGGMEARNSKFEPVWSARLSDLGGFQASPTVDCPRGGSAQHGVLYAATDVGEVVAVVVDSPGLDSTAPWPKYQHDVRNTGNPATPIQSCP